MTLQEAYKAWGGKADHLLTYHRTKNVFEIGFKALDFNKQICEYDKSTIATALSNSDLNDSDKYIAAGVMCSVLKEYSDTCIFFSAKDLIECTINNQKVTTMNNTKPKCVQQLDPETDEIICTYNSISEAQNRIGVKNIYQAVKSGKTAGGYKWKLIEEDKPIVNVENKKPIVNVENKKPLEEYSNQELIDEMKRRGWKGDIEIVTKVKL